MERNFAAAMIAVLVVGSVAPAQLVPGDIGVTGFSTTNFSVISQVGPSAAYNVGSFGGSGTTQAILWDRANPNAFIVGGFGFVGRAIVTGTGMATYTLLTSGVSTASQMSFDFAGQIVVADAGIDQMVMVDPNTGTVTPITTGAQPWAGTLNAGAVHPVTGDVYAGSQGAIHRIPFGSVTAVSFASGWSTSTSYVSGITFDPFTGDVIASLLSVARVVRISPAGALTDLVPPGSIGSVNSVAIDLNGDIIAGSSSGNVWRIPNAGGQGVMIGTATGGYTSASGVSVMGAEVFRVFVTPQAGGGNVDILGIPAGTVEGWLVVSGDTSLPVNQGPVFGFNPDGLTLFILTAFPVPSPGHPFHWTYPVPAPLFPAGTLLVPPGTIGPGLSVDFIAVALDAVLSPSISPVTRATF